MRNFLTWVETAMQPAESRIELTCVMTPHSPDETEVEREEETRTMWEVADAIAKKMGVRTRFSDHEDSSCRYGDGYVYPSLALLETVLNAFDQAQVDYDNIDLPRNAPQDLVARLQERFPRGYGVMVNLGHYP